MRALSSGARGRALQRPMLVAAAGVALHVLSVLQYTTRYGELPLVGLAPSLSTLSLLIGLGLVATLGLGEAGRIGILLVPLMIVLEALAMAYGIQPTASARDFSGAWFALHVTLGLAAVGSMALAGAAGALYLIQFRELKSKRLGRIFRFLPPLATLDRVGRVGVVTGFSTLTIAIVLGWAWTVRFRGSLGAQNPETIWAVFFWTVTFGALAARLGGGRVERRAAIAGVVGFLLVVASYLVVRASAGAGGFFL